MSKLVLELLADSNGLLKNLDRAQASVDRFVRASDAAGQSLGGGVNRALDLFTDLASGGARAAGVLAGGIVAVATAAAFMTVSAGKQVEAIDQLSQKTGIAVQSIQGWSVIMAENDFQAETLTGSMRTLAKQMIEARNPASQAAATFDELGISITALGSTESTIRAVADKFQDLPDGPDKARLAVTLFGKAGLDMIPMLNRGAAAFDASREASERFGAVLSTQQVAALNAVDDASDRLGVAMDGLKLQLAATFAPAVEVSINTITAAIGKLTTGLVGAKAGASSFFDEFRQKHPLISSILLGDVAGHAAPPPLFPPAVTGPQQDSHVAEFALANGQRQEELGTRIRNQLIEKVHLLQAEQHAQEALGRVLVQIAQRQQADVKRELDDLFEQERHINELTANEEAGYQIVLKSVDAWAHRNDLLEMEVGKYRALDQVQQATFRTESGFFGASDAARRVRFGLIDAEAALERAKIDETIFGEERKAQAILDLEEKVSARRREGIQQFPTFFEQQMQSIVASNAFSVGQIVTTWTSGLANAAVNGGNFALAAWKSTQVALLQGVLNTGVQMAAQWALNASVEMGILTATEAAKLGLKTASNATIVAGEAATATASVSIWSGASAAIVGAFATVGAGFAAVGASMVGVLTAVGGFVMGVLSAIAEALTATVFGIPYAGAILLGVAAIAIALAATGNLGFKDGGIGDFGSGTPATLHGQEAIIPLNGRGAAFMQSVFGAGGGQPIVQSRLYMNGREFARALSDEQPGALRTMGAF